MYISTPPDPGGVFFFIFLYFNRAVNNIYIQKYISLKKWCGYGGGAGGQFMREKDNAQ